MDKETLSNYGWIVICVMVMAVMLALATPFGSYIAAAVGSTTQGLFDTNQNALDSAGIEIMEQEFDLMLNGPSVNTPLKFGQPYQMTTDGMLIEYVFYADGSATMWIADAYGGYMPAGTVTYTETEVILEGDPVKISTDGTYLYDPEDETFRMTVNSITPGKPKTNTDLIADQNGLIGITGFAVQIGTDGSITIYQNGVAGETIPASAITWHDNHFVIKEEGQEDAVGAIYPNGSKITIGEIVFALNCTHENTTTTNIEPNCGNDGMMNAEVCTSCGKVVTAGTVIPANNNHIFGANDICTICNGWKIPDGGTYYVGVTSSTAGDYTGATAIYTAGQAVCGLRDGDIYVYGDYEYRYNKTFWGDASNGGGAWAPQTSLNGWSARVIDTNKTSYGVVETKINNKPVSSLMYAYAYCANLVTSPAIPNGVTLLRSAYEGCSKLENAPEIPSTATNILGAFKNCTSLEISPVLPEGVISVSRVFSGCTSLTTAPIIPSTAKSAEGTFYGCTNLKTYLGSTSADGDFSNYKIPEGVQTLGEMFAGCKSLVLPPQIPSSAISVSSMFSGCTAMTTAPVIPNSKLTSLSSIFMGCTSLKTYVGAPAGTTDGDFSGFVIPNNITELPSTFSGCTSLTVAPSIPNGVLSLSFTFSECKSLISAPTIPNTVTNMRNTFGGCKALTVAPSIPSGVTDIRHLYYGCSNLKTYIGAPTGTADGDFSGYVLPQGITSIAGTFGQCSLLTKIPVIPESVTDVSSMIYVCGKITEVILPSNLTSIGGHAFGNCYSLNDIEIPKGVTVIANHAFFDCYSLEEIVIPKGVTEIGNQAFAYCYKLTSITFEGTVEQWNSITFGKLWNDGTPATEVICSDGTVSLS